MQAIQRNTLSKAQSMTIFKPTIITKEKFWSYVEHLPVGRWGIDGNLEVFHTNENFGNDTVRWCVTDGVTHWSIIERRNLTRNQVANMVRGLL